MFRPLGGNEAQKKWHSSVTGPAIFLDSVVVAINIACRMGRRRRYRYWEYNVSQFKSSHEWYWVVSKATSELGPSLPLFPQPPRLLLLFLCHSGGKELNKDWGWWMNRSSRKSAADVDKYLNGLLCVGVGCSPWSGSSFSLFWLPLDIWEMCLVGVFQSRYPFSFTSQSIQLDTLPPQEGLVLRTMERLQFNYRVARQDFPKDSSRNSVSLITFRVLRNLCTIKHGPPVLPPLFWLITSP